MYTLTDAKQTPSLIWIPAFAGKTNKEAATGFQPVVEWHNGGYIRPDEIGTPAMGILGIAQYEVLGYDFRTPIV